MTEQHKTPEISAEKIPGTLPILPLFDAALFPKMVLPLVVMQPESIQLVDEAMSKDRLIGLVVAKKPVEENVNARDNLNTVGTVALILKMAKTEDNKLQLLAQGLGRFEVKKYVQEKPYLKASVKHIKDIETKDKEIDALISNMIGQFSRVAELSPGLPQEIVAMAKSIQEPGILADMISSTINTSLEEKQRILEIYDIKKRLKEVTRLLNYQLEILELGSKIQSQVKGDMDKRQREYFLREQLKAIKEELGEKDEAAVEVEDYKAKIEKKNFPEDPRKEA